MSNAKYVLQRPATNQCRCTHLLREHAGNNLACRKCRKCKGYLRSTDLVKTKMTTNPQEKTVKPAKVQKAAKSTDKKKSAVSKKSQKPAKLKTALKHAEAVTVFYAPAKADVTKNGEVFCPYGCKTEDGKTTVRKAGETQTKTKRQRYQCGKCKHYFAPI